MKNAMYKWYSKTVQTIATNNINRHLEKQKLTQKYSLYLAVSKVMNLYTVIQY